VFNVLLMDDPGCECDGIDCSVPGLIDGKVGARAKLAALILSASSRILDASRRSWIFSASSSNVMYDDEVNCASRRRAAMMLSIDCW
jgi:hypothetical protein